VPLPREIRTRFDHLGWRRPWWRNRTSGFSTVMSSRAYVLLSHSTTYGVAEFLFCRSKVSGEASEMGSTCSWVTEKFVGQTQTPDHTREADHSAQENPPESSTSKRSEELLKRNKAVKKPMAFSSSGSVGPASSPGILSVLMSNLEGNPLRLCTMSGAM
jgi:hypothetical protein